MINVFFLAYLIIILTVLHGDIVTILRIETGDVA